MAQQPPIQHRLCVGGGGAPRRWEARAGGLAATPSVQPSSWRIMYWAGLQLTILGLEQIRVFLLACPLRAPRTCWVTAYYPQVPLQCPPQ